MFIDFYFVLFVVLFVTVLIFVLCRSGE